MIPTIYLTWFNYLCPYFGSALIRLVSMDGGLGMVLAGKLFKLSEYLDIDSVAGRLRGFRREEFVDIEGHEFKPVTEIVDLRIGEGRLFGVFSEDLIFTTIFRGEVVPVPTTREAPFVFSPHPLQEETMVFILDKKARANNIANKLSQVLFIEGGRILEARITHETLKTLHESNPEATRITFFDDVDLPNIDKLSLYGAGLADTSLYSDYLKHGKIWYVVYESQKQDFTVGITRNCVVTVFSKAEQGQIFEFVLEELVPLVELAPKEE